MSERVTNEGMLCPNCRVSLVMAERQTVGVDYCPTCRGVWLDRGKLDKIIERAAAEARAGRAAHPLSGSQDSPPESPRQPWSLPGHADYHSAHHDDEHGYRDHERQGRKRSWLANLFE